MSKEKISKNWDSEFAGGTYEEIKAKCLFACLWHERPEGGYTRMDFEPFIALQKVNNQGVEAYEGINISEEKQEGNWVVNIKSKSYIPLNVFKALEERMFVTNDPDEVVDIFLKRFSKKGETK